MFKQIIVALCFYGIMTASIPAYGFFCGRRPIRNAARFVLRPAVRVIEKKPVRKLFKAQPVRRLLFRRCW